MTYEKIMQKLSGVAFIVGSIFVTILDNDATTAVLFIPFGLYLIFTKKQVMAF